MQLDFMVVFSNLAGLFLLIAAGAAAVRFRLVQPEASVHFSALLIKITLPCTIFVSLVTREYDPSFLRDSMIMLTVSMLSFPLSQLLWGNAAKLLKIPSGKRGIWTFASTYSNNGFMGFPVTLALFGPAGLALAVIFGIGFNVYVYSIGAMAIASDAGVTADRPSLKKILCTGVNASILLSLLFYFGRMPLPQIALMPLTYLSNITTPLSMFITGMALGNSKGRELLSDKDAWSCTAVRLLASPLLMLFLLRLIPFPNPLIVPVVVVTMAMPTPGVTAVLAQTYSGNLDMAAKVSFLSNLLALVTIPLICLLL
ncbi:MAG: AEC family transporter [Stomatobaculum sp.]|nr:AEC family transporter [Stomatobaculum sp.]